MSTPSLRRWLRHTFGPGFTAPDAHQTGAPLPVGSGPSQEVQSSLRSMHLPVDLDAQRLSSERIRVQHLEREALQRLRTCQASMDGLVQRDAEVRLAGNHAERMGLIRLYEGLKAQHAQAQLLHDDASLYLRLVDNLLGLHASRQIALGPVLPSFATGRLASVMEQVGQELAAQSSRRAAWRDFLRDWNSHLEDANQQACAAQEEAGMELAEKSEATYQAQARQQAEHLETLAQRIDQALAEGNAARNPATTRCEPS